MTTTLPDLWQRNTLHRIRTLSGADRRTRERALRFVAALEADHLPEPHVYIAGRAETGVGITWTHELRRVDFVFLVGRENDQFRFVNGRMIDADDWRETAGSGMASWGMSGVDFCFPGRHRDNY